MPGSLTGLNHPTSGSNVPHDCCTRSAQHSGVPRGTVELITGMQTYVARPHPDSHQAVQRYSKVILFFADVFRALYTNSKLARTTGRRTVRGPVFCFPLQVIHPLVSGVRWRADSDD